MVKYIDGGITYTEVACNICGGPALIDPEADEADQCYDCIAKEREGKTYYSPRQERIRLMERKLHEERRLASEQVSEQPPALTFCRGKFIRRRSR